MEGKTFIIIGAARQGTSLAEYLVRHGADVVLNDSRKASQLKDARRRLAGLPVGWVLGGHPVRLLEGVDSVAPSGGVPLELPLLKEARRRGIQLTNDSQIFLEQAPCPVIGITGSAGKTTTTTLVGRMAHAAAELSPNFRQAWIGGNIGNPLIDVLDEVSRDDIAVMELSSFQLDLMTRSPGIAAVLNLTPNHLDRHGTMEAYAAAKANILKHQSVDGIAVLGWDDPGARGLAAQVQGRLLSFGMYPPEEDASRWGHVYPREGKIAFWYRGMEEELLDISLIELRGDHNLLNVLAACAIAVASGFPREAMRAGVEGFRGVPHRLEYIRTWRGAYWYNDSIATAPERAIAGLRVFKEPLILLAGGRDKDLPWEDFIDLICERVDHLVAFGETAGMIAEKAEAKKGLKPYTIARCETFTAALETAADLAEPGHVVLLSPGGTSFDEFVDFAARGEYFRTWLMAQK